MANQPSKEKRATKAITVDLPIALATDARHLAVTWGTTWDGLIASALRREILLAEAFGILHQPMTDHEFTKERRPEGNRYPGSVEQPRAVRDALLAAGEAVPAPQTTQAFDKRLAEGFPMTPIDRGVRTPDPLPEDQRMSDETATALIDTLIIGSTTTTTEADVDAVLRDAGVLSVEGAPR